MREWEEKVLAKQEARAEGLAEGIAEGKAFVALNLLNSGMPVEEIVKMTGLTEEKIMALKKEQ